VRADVADPAQLAAMLAAARDRQGGLDLVVNAARPDRPPADVPFGGGPIVEADLATFRTWAVAVAEQAFVFLAQAGAALRGTGGGTLVQVTGGSSLRAAAGRGPWSAGAFATRALTHAAAQELRAAGVHVALLVVDGAIGAPDRADRSAELAELADAVAFLADDRAHRSIHELVLAPADRPGEADRPDA
jgi:NAD(P)-dependent dehydrogenase (short-subunit alcohol dehydrogenase family)